MVKVIDLHRGPRQRGPRIPFKACRPGRSAAVAVFALLLAVSGFPVRVYAGLVWPQPPAEARIAFEGAYPRAIEPEKSPGSSFLLRAFRFIVGLGSGSGPDRAALVRPTGVFVRNGNVYVADSGRRVVVKFSPGGRHTDIGPKGSKRMSAPVGVVVSPDGRIFVSDPPAGAVFIFDSKGRSQGQLESRSSMQRPTGMALDESRGHLWVADTGSHCVRCFSLDGKPVLTLGKRGKGNGEFNFPGYIWVDQATGELYVCDAMNFRVQTFGPNGAFHKSIGKVGDQPGYLARPRGLCRDSDGNLYVVDAAMETVQILDSQGQLLLWFGLAGSDEGDFNLPSGIYCGPDDRLYVADTYNGRVQVFKYIKKGQGI